MGDELPARPSVSIIILYIEEKLGVGEPRTAIDGPKTEKI